MLNSCEGKSVVVTGASKGIGKGIAAVFARHGAKVLVVARNLEQADACASELRAGGGQVSAFGGDVTKRSDMDEMTRVAVERNGGIDILCANAGIFPQSKLEDMSGADWDTVLSTNVKGMHFSIQATLPALKRSRCGRIVLTSSITGPVTGFPGWAHYGASKAAQLGFMRTACIELAKYGITINAVLPGNIKTEGLADLGADYERTMAASIPLKRLGTVDDIGYAAMFLASDQAGYITGQTLIVDGGQTLPESLEALNQA